MDTEEGYLVGDTGREELVEEVLDLLLLGQVFLCPRLDQSLEIVRVLFHSLEQVVHEVRRLVVPVQSADDLPDDGHVWPVTRVLVPTCPHQLHQVLALRVLLQLVGPRVVRVIRRVMGPEAVLVSVLVCLRTSLYPLDDGWKGLNEVKIDIRLLLGSSSSSHQKAPCLQTISWRMMAKE